MTSAIQHQAAPHAGGDRLVAAGMPRLFARQAAPRARAGASSAALRTAGPVLADARPVPADSRRGPGWFDSSWELRQGLEVREGLPVDVRLNEWIEVCLFER